MQTFKCVAATNAVLSGEKVVCYNAKYEHSKLFFVRLENTCYAMGLPIAFVVKNTTVNVSKTLAKCTCTALAPNSEF